MATTGTWPRRPQQQKPQRGSALTWIKTGTSSQWTMLADGTEIQVRRGERADTAAYGYRVTAWSSGGRPQHLAEPEDLPSWERAKGFTLGWARALDRH